MRSSVAVPHPPPVHAQRDRLLQLNAAAAWLAMTWQRLLWKGKCHEKVAQQMKTYACVSLLCCE